MTTVPVFFGDPERPLFGQLHVPPGGLARGGVVLCPPIGIEAMSAHPAFRAIGEALAESGLAALRFDYLGTGDSSGDLEDPTIVSQWSHSAVSAAAFLRACGAERVGMLGMRVGALLAAKAAVEDGDVEALVLWDPVSSGRAFLRQQQALKSMSIGETPELAGGVELLGMLLAETQAAELTRLSLKDLVRPLARQVLLLERPEQVGLLDADGLGSAATETGVAQGQAEFVDVLPDLARLPSETIEAIAKWCEAAFPERSQPFEVRAGREATVARTEHGEAILERAVEVGPLPLFGIVTEPSWGATGPTVICLNAGLIPHVGPARLWVSLARRLAQAGLRTCRVDLSGLGDSGAREDQQRQQSYPHAAMEDVAALCAALAPEDPTNVVFVGLCAGAYHSIEAGIALGVRGVCPINPILSFQPPEMRAGEEKDAWRQAVQPYNPLFERLRRHAALRRFGERAIPPALWWLLDRLNLQPSPARGLVRLRAAGVDTLLICGEVEASPFIRRAGSTMRHLTSAPGLRFEVLEGIDHTLFGAEARARAFAILVEHLEVRFATARTRLSETALGI